MNKRKRYAIIFLILSGVLLIIYFSARNYFLRKVFEHVADKLKRESGALLTVSQIHFSGFDHIEMHQLSLVPENGDTLVNADSILMQPSLISLLSGKLKLKELYLDNVNIFLSCHDNNCNYDSLLKKKKNETAENSSTKNYSSIADHFITGIFNLAPQTANLRNIRINYSGEDQFERLVISSITSSGEKLEGSFLNLSDSSRWNLSGAFSGRKKTFDVKIFPGNKKSFLPILKSMFGMNCSFDTIHFELSDYYHSGRKSQLTGNMSADHFAVMHPKISDEAVQIRHADFSYKINVGEHSIELDSSSNITLNEMNIHPYFDYVNDQLKIYNFKINTDNVPANDFFRSLPEGIFDEVKDVEADGNLEFKLNFQLDSSQPDSLHFETSLKKEKFHLKKDGNLLKMNDEFSYSVYEHDKFVRSFMVGNSNPDFTPLNMISQNLRNAVMTSEDGSFFFHNGFNEDAFRKSIAANYKAGKFVRGGSTITMQLVKNVFLTRHKTVARKAEEALIVWLIESNRLCSKERMLEVYLNIIELGPNIYGIGEASRFYFSKKPSELTLAESVFLASLLPHPKWFKYSFDEQGNLKPYFADYYRVVANFLLKKNLISQDEYDHLQPHVELKGPAKNMLTPVENVPNQENETEEGM